MSIEDENQKLRDELKLQKQTSWQTIMSWRTRYSKTQESLQAEIESRDKQLRDIAASLILLESQLQKERKRMASEMTQKDETITQLQAENQRLNELDHPAKVYIQNKPQPITHGSFNDQLVKSSERKSRRAVSEDRKSDSDRARKSDSDRARKNESARKTKTSSSSGQVVIERRSREKRIEKNIASDSSEEDALKKKKLNSSDRIRRSTRSMRDPSPISMGRKSTGRSDRGSTSSSSDEACFFIEFGFSAV